jgi:hypothetical protein
MLFANSTEWANKNWGNADLNDKRRNKRAVKLAEQMLAHPDASIPKQMEDWKDIKAAYRLFDSPEVTHATIQGRHYENVIHEAATGEREVVLFIQDGSELDFTKHQATLNLGPIGNHKGTGIMIHSTLAIKHRKDGVKILGLAKQYAWTRGPVAHGKKETRVQRNQRDNEGDYWITSLESIETPLKSSNIWVSVGDRANDMFRFLSFCKTSNWNYVVRACWDRKIYDPIENKGYLKQYVRTLPSQATKTLELRSRDKKPARTAELKISWSKIYVLPPKLKGKELSREPIAVWVIRCWEDSEDVKKEDRLEWFLLTNFEINTPGDALEKISWYECRWTIEEYHKSLKSGCAVEKRQLKEARRLLALLGFLGIIATKILEIKHIARGHPNEPAKRYVPPLLLKIICAKHQTEIDLITMRQFWHKVAGLGGFIGRKSDGNPGWQTLWGGWLRLLDMYLGATYLGEKCG